MVDFEELKRSLLTIKKECEKHDCDCTDCPLAAKGYNTCGVVGNVSSSDTYRMRPLYWKIVEEPRLFER